MKSIYIFSNHSCGKISHLLIPFANIQLPFLLWPSPSEYIYHLPTSQFSLSQQLFNYSVHLVSLVLPFSVFQQWRHWSHEKHDNLPHNLVQSSGLLIRVKPKMINDVARSSLSMQLYTTSTWARLIGFLFLPQVLGTHCSLGLKYFSILSEFAFLMDILSE